MEAAFEADDYVGCVVHPIQSEAYQDAETRLTQIVPHHRRPSVVFDAFFEEDLRVSIAALKDRDDGRRVVLVPGVRNDALSQSFGRSRSMLPVAVPQTMLPVPVGGSASGKHEGDE